MLYPLKPSFAGGELTPALYGRTDLQKYDVGAATLENAIVLRYGGVSSRPGFRFVARTAGNAKARLIPFMFSTTQNYVLEFTPGKIRFYTEGGIVVDTDGNPIEVATTYTADELATIKYAQSADMLFLVQPNHPPCSITRYSVTDWRLEQMDINLGPFDDPNKVDDLKITPAGKSGNITLTATKNYFTSSMVGQTIRLGHTVPSQYKTGKPGGQTSALAFSGTLNGTFSGTITVPSGTVVVTDSDGNKSYPTSISVSGASINGTFNGTWGTSISGSFSGTVGTYTATAVSGTFSGTQNGSFSTSTSATSLQVTACPGSTVYVESFGFWNGNFTVEKFDRGTGTWVAMQTQSGNRSQNYNLQYTNDSDEIETYRVTSTAFDTSVWSGENEKQRGYITIQSFAKDYYGVVKINSVSSGTSATGTVIKELGALGSTNDFSLQAWGKNKGYPYCVGFFEDRLVFAGSNSKPQTYWASHTGDYFNFWVNTPQADDDSISGTLSCGQMNGIKAMVPFSEMLMFTAGGEYKVGGGSDAFTPTNQQAKPQEYRGINDLTPVIIGGRVVYVQHQGSIVRDLTYSYNVDKYTGDDISILAAHLFEGHTINSMTFQQTPNSIVWCVREDGVLLGMTYIKEQDVYAWHRHTTQGEFVDVCSIGGSESDELWAVIKRGSSYYVEQMASQVRNTVPSEQFYVDSGYMYRGTPTNEITGLTHLAGKDVQVLADGNALTDCKVDVDGKLTLSNSFSKIVVGLPYTMKIETLPIEINARDGAYTSRRERIARMMVMFRDTRGGNFGISESALDEIKWRATEAYGTPIELFNGKKYVVIPQSSYLDTIQIIIKQEQPLPMTVLSIVPEVHPGG